MITAFVSVMMLLIEYLHVTTGGGWQKRLAQWQWGQYLAAATLGATPGCLGAFTAVAMYSHGGLTLGAIVAAMIATSGDEAFVMLALMPERAWVVFGVLFTFGIVAGAAIDGIAGRPRTRAASQCLEVHALDRRDSFSPASIFEQWRQCSAARGAMTGGLLLLLTLVVSGNLGPAEWNWIRVTLLVVTAIAIFFVASVSDHFLEEHLWRHVIVKHAPQLLLWTLGALLVMHAIADMPDLESKLRERKWPMLLVACLIGLIPESGPHLIFVTLYAEGVAPLSVLLASSVVQDGHAMLPMLAHSRREFLLVKGINFAAGLAIGSVGLCLES